MTPFTSTSALSSRLQEPRLVVIDCRFDLANPAWGEAAWAEAHIPGAQYAHLDRDLSGAKTGRNGRHPLPDMDALRARLGAWGIGPGIQVVCYDQGSGMWASRLWWLLRYLGHAEVSVLEGGLARWTAEGLPLRGGLEAARPPAFFQGEPQPEMVVTTAEVLARLGDPAWRIVDSRAPERYRGEVEPIDPVAGHIPGAVNLYNLAALNPDFTLLPADTLRARFLAALGDTPPEHVITYCGSGVAGAHNALLMEAAGLPGAKVYAGSWSEWCSDRERPVER